MRGSLTVMTILTLVSSLSCAVKADPITGTVTLTVEPTTTVYGRGPGIESPLVFSSGNVNLGSLPASLALTGPPMGLTGTWSGGWIGENLAPAYNMTITFDGASGSHPTINVTGYLHGFVSEGQGPTASSSFFAQSASTATLQGWTPDSGIPQSLINTYLYPPHYQFDQQVSASSVPSTATLALTVNSTPEPGTVVFYLAAIGGLAVKRRAIVRRSPATR